MRVELGSYAVAVAPGGTAELRVDVHNGNSVIDGISARVMGLDAQWVKARPGRLALFPDTGGSIDLRISLPREFPAGTHTVAIEVASSVDPLDVEVVPFELEVRPATEAVVAIEPSRITGRSDGEFEASVTNVGNTPIEVALVGGDDERTLSFAFVPAVLEVAPGTSVIAAGHIAARRRLFGSPLERGFTVTASSRDGEYDASGTFVHQPIIPRGVLTALMLLGIIAIWALVFLAVLGAILDEDQAEKAAPASFFATSEAVQEATGGAGAGGADPEDKIDARAVGGSIGGTVTSSTAGEPVGRITVDAVRITRNGPITVASSATDDEGAFQLGGLPPGRYSVRYSAPGFREVWYPDAPSRETAETLRIGALEEQEGLDVTVEGLPGSIAGLIDTGDSTGVVPVSILVRPLVGGVPGPPISATTASAENAFAAAGLPTPALYELTITAPGYQPTTRVERLGGGEARITTTVRLSAGEGSISGIVTDGERPLGGVTIHAVSGDVDLTSATPTSGAVGRFDLGGLPTPGTYLLTFSREGFGGETVAVSLGPGEERADVEVVLVLGTGSISGRATTNGSGLGDVAVTVSGNGTTVNTSTLTAGGIGSYAVGGLSTPGRYTLTFALPGFATQTLAVDLGPSGSAPGIDVVMVRTSGTIRGTVTSCAGGVAGVTITLTDGRSDVTTAAASDPAGAYVATGLAPGSYAVTFTASGFPTETVLVELPPGGDVVQDVVLDATCEGEP